MTLGVDGAWDVYRKLLWDVDTYKQAAAHKVPAGDRAAEEIRYPVYAAINTAATAWSLVEWLWFEVEHLPDARSGLLMWAEVQDRGETLKRLKPAIRRKIPDLDACNQIAHATKHAQLHDVTPGFTTRMHYDVWEREGQLYFSQDSRLSSGGEDGGEPLQALFERVSDWWGATLKKYGVPDRLHLVPGETTVR